jgi:chromosome segregation ATPase
MTGQAGRLHKELAKAKKDLADTQQQLSSNIRMEKDSKSKALTKANNDYRTSMMSKLNTKRDKVYDLNQQLKVANNKIARLKREPVARAPAPGVAAGSIEHDIARANL